MTARRFRFRGELPKRAWKVLRGLFQSAGSQGGFTLWEIIVALLILLAVMASLWVWSCSQRTDEIRFTNGGTGERGVLVDAASGSPPWNDRDFLAPTGPKISLRENVTGTGEIIAFANGWRPTLKENVDWKDSVTTVDFTFENELTIPIDIWILKGPYNPADETLFAQPNHARLSAYDTNELIWRSEAAGLVLDISIHDATVDPDAAPEADPDADPNTDNNLLDFTCDDATTTVYDRNGSESPNTNNIQHRIGYTPNRINVYVVETVYGSVSAGVHCGEVDTAQDWGLIALGYQHSTTLLAHELGHALSLGHVNDRNGGTVLPGFDDKNVMHDNTVNRRYLTEGQTFRQVLDPHSAVERVYSARQPLTTGRSTIDCPAFLADNVAHPRNQLCPTLGRRLWPDGGLGPGP